MLIELCKSNHLTPEVSAKVFPAAGYGVVAAVGGRVESPEGEQLLCNKKNLLNPYFIVSA